MLWTDEVDENNNPACGLKRSALELHVAASGTNNAAQINLCKCRQSTI